MKWSISRLKISVKNMTAYTAVKKLYTKLRWTWKSRTCRLVLEESFEDAQKKVEKQWPDPDRAVLQHLMKNENGTVLSVIIPVYNMEKYLKECLDSVLSQTCLWPVEIIAVDDGSKDGSTEILSQYEKKSGITVIRKENGGLSSARNVGIEAAQGRYLTFLDSDDLLTEGCIERALQKAIEEECDIVQMQYIRLADQEKYPSRVALPKENLTQYAEMCRIPGHACMKIYKRELFEGVRFPEGYWFEDTIVHLILFQGCKKMGFVQEPGYIYRYNTQGISYKKHESLKCLEAYWIVPHVLRMREDLKMIPDQTVYQEVLYHFAGLLYHRIKSVDEETRQAVFILCCHDVGQLRKKLLIDPALPEPLRNLENAFLKKDYGTWKLYCQCF